MKRILIAACVSLTCSGAEVTGAAKLFSTLSFSRDVSTPSGPSTADPVLGATGRFRIQIAENLLDSARGEMAYEWVPVWTESGGQFAGTNAFSSSEGLPYRVADFSRHLIRGGNADLFHNLDRFNAVLYLPMVDITVGRQAVSLGAARVISPLDVLTPFNYDSLDTEYRTGVDAVTARIPLGSLSELAVGVLAGDGFAAEKSAAYLRARHHVTSLGTDLNGALISHQGSTLAGLGVETALFGAGVWWEAAYSWVRRLHSGDRTQYFRTSVGLDYSPLDGVYVLAEFHYNGAGDSDPGQYLARLKDFAYRKGGVFLLGRHYLSLGATWTVTPLLSLGTTYIQNLNDGSLIVAANGEYNFSQDWYFTLGTYVGIGEGPSSTASPPSPSTLALRSELGSGGTFLFGSLRYYF